MPVWSKTTEPKVCPSRAQGFAFCSPLPAWCLARLCAGFCVVRDMDQPLSVPRLICTGCCDCAALPSSRAKKQVTQNRCEGRPRVCISVNLQLPIPTCTVPACLLALTSTCKRRQPRPAPSSTLHARFLTAPADLVGQPPRSCGTSLFSASTIGFGWHQRIL
jgi:hypothetical protein